MKPKTIVLICLAMAALAASGLGLILFLVKGVGTRTTPQALVWDFRKGPGNPDEVNWPASVIGNTWDLRGNFDLTIIGGSGDVVFHENVQHIICRRKGNKLTDIYLHFGSGSSAEEAYLTAKRVMTKLSDDERALAALETWHDAITRRISMKTYIADHQHDRDVFGTVMLYPSFTAGHVRLSETSGGGKPEKGNVSYTISVAFP